MANCHNRVFVHDLGLPSFLFCIVTKGFFLPKVLIFQTYNFEKRGRKECQAKREQRGETGKWMLKLHVAVERRM